MGRRKKLSQDEKYVLFEDRDECAREAAKTFSTKGWRWKDVGTPDQFMILTELGRLRMSAGVENADSAGSGRLICIRNNERFQYGYERPKELANAQ